MSFPPAPSLPSFGGLHPAPGDAKIFILPVPYDCTTSFEPGARWGPSALLNASIQLELYDEETGIDLNELAIVTLPPVEPEVSGPEKMVGVVEEACAAVLEGGKAKLAVIGGEHTIAVGVLRAHKHLGSEFDVLQLDAHTDLRESYQGSRFSHACAMARVGELYPLVQLGIRSTSREEAGSLDRERVLWARDIHEDMDGALDRLDGLLGKRVYVTVDLDVLDPSCFPSTGTPEPGGLDWYQATRILRHVGATRDVVGFDFTEHSPRPGLHAPDYLAARLLAKSLVYFWGEIPRGGGKGGR